MSPELEREIAAIARTVFRRHGPEAPTRLIARELGMTPAKLLARVGSKERLLLMAYGEDDTAVFAALEAGVRRDQPARPQLYRLLLDLNSELERLIGQALVHAGEPSSGPATEHWPVVARKLLSRWLAQAAAQQALEVNDASLTAQVLVGTLESRILTGYLTRKTHSAQQHRVFVRALIRLLFPAKSTQSTSAW
jgi:AcrR family transcriptional regulator